MAGPLNFEISLTPAWGEKRVALVWTGSFQEIPTNTDVQVSVNGHTGWRSILHEGVLDQEGGTFTHDLSSLPASQNMPFYRVVFVGDTWRFNSQAVTPITPLTGLEWHTVSTILAHELLDMGAGNGQKAWLLRPRQWGEYADSYDPVTGSITSPTTDISGFGEKYKGGYAEPLEIWVRLGENQTSRSPDSQGMGIQDTQILKARTLNIPEPAERDLVIIPGNKYRYLVHGQPQHHRFLGHYPVSSDIQLFRLPLNSIKYKVPI